MSTFIQIIVQFLAQTFPGAPKWTVKDIPNLKGKVAIVTGSNTGIGKEIARALLEHDAKVYIAARSQERAAAAIKDLFEQTGKEALFLQLDLGNLKSIKASAEEFFRLEKELHILFNNAGVMFPPVNLTTEDGYDLQFGINVIGHFYFTQLLLPTMLSTAQNSADKVRIVNLSSFAAYLGSLNYNTFKDGPARRKLSSDALYNQSKFGNIVVANELARRYGDQGIVSTSLNPGHIKTDLQRYMNSVAKFVIQAIQHPASTGAITSLWAGTVALPAEINGKFLVPWARVGAMVKGADDPQTEKELWTWLEEQTKNVQGD